MDFVQRTCRRARVRRCADRLRLHAEILGELTRRQYGLKTQPEEFSVSIIRR